MPHHVVNIQHITQIHHALPFHISISSLHANHPPFPFKETSKTPIPPSTSNPILHPSNPDRTFPSYTSFSPSFLLSFFRLAAKGGSKSGNPIPSISSPPCMHACSLFSVSVSHCLTTAK